ncbi:MAG: RluA family pseudouridine synthase [Candidatus Saccharimonadaceae bacterium]
MAKSLQAELLAILRKYELAGELTKRKEISNIKEFPERQLSRLIKFTYEKQSYYVLFDTSAGDDVQVVLDHIRLDIPDIEGNLVRNPLEGSMKAYGMPHMGKDAYLLTKKVIKIRLDQELVRRYPEFSRSTIQKYIKSGYVLLNGEVATTSKKDVTENDDIALVPPTREDISDKELPIIYLDDNVIVVNKPAGVLTHSKGALNDEFTVADFFRRYTTNGLDSTRSGIVHRLDRDTSGVIIGARNDETALLLKKQFADRTTKKQYTAIVDGVPKLEEALIDLPIARNPSAPSTFKVDSKGKAAITAYTMIRTNGKQSLVELRPRTGRTHQLRVHMQYINNPIAGDRIYGDIRTAKRLCLHAHSLEITIPMSDRKVFTAPVPEYFKELV